MFFFPLKILILLIAIIQYLMFRVDENYRWPQVATSWHVFQKSPNFIWRFFHIFAAQIPPFFVGREPREDQRGDGEALPLFPHWIYENWCDKSSKHVDFTSNSSTKIGISKIPKGYPKSTRFFWLPKFGFHARPRKMWILTCQNGFQPMNRWSGNFLPSQNGNSESGLNPQELAGQCEAGVLVVTVSMLVFNSYSLRLMFVGLGVGGWGLGVGWMRGMAVGPVASWTSLLTARIPRFCGLMRSLNEEKTIVRIVLSMYSAKSVTWSSSSKKKR